MFLHVDCIFYLFILFCFRIMYILSLNCLFPLNSPALQFTSMIPMGKMFSLLGGEDGAARTSVEVSFLFYSCENKPSATSNI